MAMGIRTATRVAAVAFALALSACGSFPNNPPLAKYDPSAGYRFDQPEQGNNSDEVFVILVFSAARVPPPEKTKMTNTSSLLLPCSG